MPTGTQILALARIRAQDNDTVNPAVSDTAALALLNDILIEYRGEGVARRTYMAASATGMTFAADASTAVIPITAEVESVSEAYQSGASSVAQPTGEPLRRISVTDMKALLGALDDGTFNGSGSGEDWDCWAIEPISDGTNLWRIYVHPRLAVQKYLTLEVTTSAPMAALSENAGLTRRDANIVTKFLAWEMARLQKRPAEFLDQILARMPKDALTLYKNAATLHGQSRPDDAVDYDR